MQIGSLKNIERGLRDLWAIMNISYKGEKEVQIGEGKERMGKMQYLKRYPPRLFTNWWKTSIHIHKTSITHKHNKDQENTQTCKYMTD